MAGARRSLRPGDSGKILGLLDFIDAHRQALEFDLIRLGLRLRRLATEELTWADLDAIVYGLQLDPGTAVAKDLNGRELLQWDAHAQLMAGVFDQLGITNYLLRRTLGGDDKAEPPEQLPRPGVKPKTVQWGGHARTIEEMDRLLGWD